MDKLHPTDESQATEPEGPLTKIDELAEEFVERCRRGERPSLTSFVELHPELEAEIRDLFPALLVMEDLAPADSPPKVMPAMRLERLGDYRILHELGRGGMGVVYRAVHESLGRDVALKILPLHLSSDPKFVERFRREARAAARLHHPQIVPVFDVGQEGELHYFSMQYIAGQSLDHVLREARRLQDGDRSGRQSPADDTVPESSGGDFSSRSTIVRAAEPNQPHWRWVARIGSEVAQALQYAHVEGVLHRDIKPSNLLLDADGKAWVTDFGLAKIDDDAASTAGTVVGTVRYMPPERFRGWADPRSDVYSLGLTLYELLTLQPAFAESDHASLVRQIELVDPLPPRKLAAGIPRDLETIILKATNKEPGRRYASAGDLAEDLRRFLECKPISARRLSTVGRGYRWCRRNPYLAGSLAFATLLLVLIAVGASIAAARLAGLAADLREQSGQLATARDDALHRLFHATTNEARAARNSAGLGRRLRTLDAVGRAAALLPQVPHDAADVLELRNLAAAALTYADMRVEAQIEIGNVVDAVLDDDLAVMALGGQDGVVVVRRVADRSELARLDGGTDAAAWLRFSDDGRYLAVGYSALEHGRQDRVCVWDWRGHRAVIDTRGYRYGITFDPDSRLVAIPQLGGTVEVYTLATGDRTLLLKTEGDPPYPRFQPGQETLIVASKRARKVQRFDVRTGEPRSDLVLPRAPEGICCSPDGRLLAYGTADNHVALWDLAQMRHAGTLAGHRSLAWPWEFSPAAHFLVTRSWDDRVILWETSSCRAIVEAPGVAVQLSRDGRRLAVHDQGKRVSIYEIFMPDEYQRVTCSTILCCVAVSPDGALVAAADDGGVWLFDAQSHVLVRHFASGNCRAVAFHPGDGSLLATSPQGVLRWTIRRRTASQPTGEAEWHFGEAELIGRSDVAASYQCLALNGDGGRFVYAAADRKLCIASWHDPAEQMTLAVEPDLPHRDSIAISPDGRWVAGVDAVPLSASHLSHLSVWDTASNAVIHRLDCGGGRRSVLFSPDGEQLVVRTQTEYLVLECGSWRERHRIAREPTTCSAMAFTPDGRIAALAHSNQVIHLYDAKTFELRVKLDAPVPLDYYAFCFTPDGARLYAVAESGTIDCWDLGRIREHLSDLGLDWE